MATEKLSVILELVSGQYKREAREAAAATGSIGQAATTASGGTGKLAGSLGGMVGAAKAAGAALAAAAVVKFATDSVAAASNLEESMNAVNVVFGKSSEAIHTFGQVSAQAVGLSTREFNQLATVTGAMLTNLGMNADAAGKETIRLTQRASDMASVFNTDVPTAMAAINSALKGEANPIEQFGVKLNDAAVRARAVELGLAATTAAVDANGKAAATLSLIYEQTNKTAGDFAATSDSLANSQRRAAAAMENAQARFGKAVTPVVANLMDRFAEGIERVAFAFGDKAAGASIVFNEAMKGLNDELAAGTLGTEDLANSILHIAANSDLSTAQLETLATAAGLGADQWDIFGESMEVQMEAMGIAPEIIDEVNNAIRGVGVAAGETAAPVEEVTEDVKRYGTASSNAAREARGMAAAQRQVFQAFLESINPAVAAAAALGRMQDAQAALIEITKDGEYTAVEYAEAQLELATATLEAQGALDAFDAGGVEAAGTAIAAALGISYEAALELLETLNLIDDKVVTVDVVTNFTERREATSSGSGSGRTYLGGKAFGGPVSANTPYLVGERGQEIFVPQQSGSIISNAQLRSMSRPNVTGPTIVVQSPMKDFRTDLQYATVIASVKNLVEAF